MIKNYNNTVTLHDYTFEFDTAGNLATKKDKGTTNITYAYDSLNRMSSTTISGTTTSYDYNAVDYKTVSGTTTENSYIQGNLGEIINGVLYANSVNGQGDVVGSTQYSSNSYSSYKYDAYGNKTSGGSALTPLAYRCQYYNSETGLYYLQARYYDPSTQQFTQEDTYWGNETNLYGYCGSNPVLARPIGA